MSSARLQGSSRRFRVAQARGHARPSTRKPAPGWQPGVGPIERVLGDRHELDRTACLADRVFFSTKPSINHCDVWRSTLHPWACRPVGLPFSRARLQTPPAPSAYRRAHAQSVPQPNCEVPVEGVIRELRRSSGNHPICRVVIAQVKGCLESGPPDLFSRTKVERHLF